MTDDSRHITRVELDPHANFIRDETLVRVTWAVPTPAADRFLAALQAWNDQLPDDLLDLPEPAALPVTFYLADCAECGPTMSFNLETNRDSWAAIHRVGTGHHVTVREETR